VGLECDKLPRLFTLYGIAGHFSAETYPFIFFHDQQREDSLRYGCGIPQEITKVTVIAKDLAHLVR
jgi:hypothetical protein